MQAADNVSQHADVNTEQSGPGEGVCFERESGAGWGG